MISLIVLGFLVFGTGCGKEPDKEQGIEGKETPIGGDDSLQQTCIVKGMVSLESGESPEGIMVYAGGTSLVSFTDEKGEFSILDVPLGKEYQFFLQKPGYKTQNLTKITFNSPGTFSLEDVVFDDVSEEEEKLGAIMGSVELEGTRDFSNVIVELEEQLIRTVTDEAGIYSIPNLEPGVYRLVFKKSGYSTEKVTVDVKPGPMPTNVPPVSLFTIQKSESNQRVINGNVEMYDVAGNVQNKFAQVVIGLEGTTHMAMPDALGNFKFTELPPARYTITATAPGYVIRDKIDIDLIDLPYTYVTVVLDEDPTQTNRTGTIRGKVTLADGSINHAGIMVGCMGTSYLALTDEEGFYTIEDVAEGSYSLMAELSGYVPVKIEPVLVLLNETTQVSEMKLDLYIEPPEILFTQPADGDKNIRVRREIPVYIWFSKKMQPASLKSAVSVSPTVDYDAYSGKEHPQSDFDILLLMLKGAYTDNPAGFNTTYKISIGSGARDIEGQQLEESYEFSFTTGEAEIIDTIPRDGEESASLSPGTPVAIFFNASIDHQTLNTSTIRLDGETYSDVEVYAYDNRRTGWTTARIRTAWEFDTEYTITIERGVRTIDGSPVSNTPYRLHFRTSRLREVSPLHSSEESD